MIKPAHSRNPTGCLLEGSQLFSELMKTVRNYFNKYITFNSTTLETVFVICNHMRAFQPDAQTMCSVFLCLLQHLHEGAEGAASFAQLQGAQLSCTQRQIPGTPLLIMSYRHHC